MKFLGLIIIRTQLFANQHKIAINCESTSSRFNGLLMHFCALEMAESTAPSLLPIRPVFVAFWARFLRRFHQNPLLKLKCNGQWQQQHTMNQPLSISESTNRRYDSGDAPGARRSSWRGVYAAYGGDNPGRWLRQ